MVRVRTESGIAFIYWRMQRFEHADAAVCRMIPLPLGRYDVWVTLGVREAEPALAQAVSAVKECADPKVALGFAGLTDAMAFADVIRVELEANGWRAQPN